MWEDIREKQRVMNARYVSSQRHTIQVDVIPFMDEIADLIGCKPNLSESLYLWSLSLHCDEFYYVYTTTINV